MTEQELIERINHIIANKIWCTRTRTQDPLQRFEYLADSTKRDYYNRAKYVTYDIIDLIKQSGYVRLCDGQRLPPTPLPVDTDATRQPLTFRDGYKWSQQDMLKAGFRKVELEEPPCSPPQ